MIDAINSGRLSLPELRGAKMEYLAKTYGVSRDTIRKALAAVEAEFAKKTISDK
jgi:DNA-binding GntR family transcriptional regulator